MSATTGTVAKWGGRAVLVAGLIASAVVLVWHTYTFERLTQRTAVGRVVGFGEYTASYKNKKFQVPTAVLEYTAGGSIRTTECRQPGDLGLGDAATVWYSPYSARAGRLTREHEGGVPPDMLDGVLVVLSVFATLLAWQLIPFLIRLPGMVADGIRDARAMLKSVRDAKAQASGP